MNLMDLQNQIKNGVINNSYIFTGEEIGIMNKYIQFISELKKLKVKRVYTFNEIESELKSKNLFNQSYIYYIYNDKELFNNERFINYFFSDNFNDNIIILRFDKIDNRKRLIKDFERVILFGKLNAEILINYIKNSFENISNNEANILINYCDNDYDRIISECEKLKIIKDTYNFSDTDTFIKCFNDKIIYSNKEDEIFDIVDKIMFMDYFGYYNNKNKVENDLLLLSLIGTYFFNLLSYKSITSYNEFDINKKTGIPIFIIKKLKQINNYHSVKKCLLMIDKIRDMEMKIKTGKVESGIGLDYIVSLIFMERL